MTASFDAAGAFDQLFSTRSGRFVGADGRSERLAVGQWTEAPDAVDRALFIDPCSGPTLDVGCGPGRLVGELVARLVPAMGIDVSREAVRQTRVRGALALRRDVFGIVPGAGRWDHALLADGNIGIGGDPVRLLSRVRELLTPTGTVIAEVAPHGTGCVRDRRRLWVDGEYSSSFAWAVVGLDAIDEIARGAGLVVTGTRTIGGRHAATLARDAA